MTPNFLPSVPLVSVVMPVYNHARYVGDALKSIIGQNWRPLEIIVIDDGSKDDSLTIINEIIKALPGEKGLSVKVIARENKGAHNTINEGLSLAKGEYIAIINSDDLYLPERLKRCVEAAIIHKSRMVFTYVDPIDDDGVPLPAEHRWRLWYAYVMMQELDVAPSLSALLLRYNIGVSTGNFLFHRSLVDDIGMFRNYRYAHDLDFLLRACRLEEPVLIREKLYRYRIHANNTISESDDRITNEVAEIVRRYLSETFVTPPRNCFAPRFDKDCYSLAATPWPRHLEKALDGLMCAPELLPSTKGTESERSHLVASPMKAHNTPRITLLSHELSRTGAPVLLRDVASALHGLGVRTHVISLGAGPLADDYALMNSPVVTEGRLTTTFAQAGELLFRLSHDPRVLSPIRKLLRVTSKIVGGISSRMRLWGYRSATPGKGPLLINSFASWPIALSLLEKWKGPAFWYIHETYEPGLVMHSGRHQARLRSLADRGKVTFIFGSDATRIKWASEGYDGEVFYWSGMNPLPDDRQDVEATEVSKKTCVILSVQSTGARKGTRSLIEAFAIGKRRGTIGGEVELRIIGAHSPSHNPISRDLLCRVMEPDLRGSVQLVPNVPPLELERHYREASYYVQSSTMECLPLALLTAMAHGLPIVSTDADGCREAILDGDTGIIAPIRQPELLAEAMSRLISDPIAANRLGQNARQKFRETFSLEATAPKLMERVMKRS